MTPPTWPVGLYTIGIRDHVIADVIRLASERAIPTIHLRGGPKGCDLARRHPHWISSMRDASRRTSPITMVTSDLDIGDFLEPGSGAASELAHLASATVELGAGAVRILGRLSPAEALGCRAPLPDLTASHGLRLLIEPHHPDWFRPRALRSLDRVLGRGPARSLLLDTGQVQGACERMGPTLVASTLPDLIGRATVIHLSDAGAGLDGIGHRMLGIAAYNAITAGHHLDVGFEWTGPDRTAETCLTRYDHSTAWWQAICRSPQ